MRTVRVKESGTNMNPVEDQQQEMNFYVKNNTLVEMGINRQFSNMRMQTLSEKEAIALHKYV